MKIILRLIILILLLVGAVKLYFYLDEINYINDPNTNGLKSNIDCNNDGIDDYTDILRGAKKQVKIDPKYLDGYYSGGYPPSSEGVCTDVIWRALMNAGYNLKNLVNTDIARNTYEYPDVNGRPDKNIDFRRVPNLKIYFSNNAQNLTLDITNQDQWQPGDIVAFSDSHIAIVSDLHAKDGTPYLIESTPASTNVADGVKERDSLEKYNKTLGISGHYRFKLNK